MMKFLGLHLFFLGLILYITKGSFAEEKDAKAPVGPVEPPGPRVTLPIDEDAEQMKLLSKEIQEQLEQGESHDFQAEVNRLLGIFINSVYPNREVFIREMISNAADALEKIRVLSFGNEEVLGNLKTLDIRIDFDKEMGTITITDTGIGMTKQDLINDLGTVAKSGTTNFLEAFSQGGDSSLIGQFGVGFYSAFLVADRVTVISKHNDDEQHIWESSADASFTVIEDPRGNTLGRGTSIILHLKADAHQYLNEKKLKDLSRRYSQFINFPIYLKVTSKIRYDIHEDESDAVYVDETTEEKPETDENSERTITKKIKEWLQLNTQRAIWLRPKEEVTDDEYMDFYRVITRSASDPSAFIHFSAEGEIEFKCILFIPKGLKPDITDIHTNKDTAIKLYVRRVLVADRIQEVLPRYMNFMIGVVDSDDLPLNVGREQLQQHKVMKVISRKMTRKALDMMKKMARTSDDEIERINTLLEDEADDGVIADLKLQRLNTTFGQFYQEYGRHLVLGCFEDEVNAPRIAKILRFHSSAKPGQLVSLESYVERMLPEQDIIYYATAETLDQIELIPQLEAFTSIGVEVIFLLGALDESCMQKLKSFDGKPLLSIQRDATEPPRTEVQKIRDQKLQEIFSPLVRWYKEMLGKRVAKVEISNRLVNEPCAIAATMHGYSPGMAKTLKSQQIAAHQLQALQGQKLFEINPSHPIMQAFLEKVKLDTSSQEVQTIGNALYDAALLASGYEVESGATISRVLTGYVARDLGISPDAPLHHMDVGDISSKSESGDADEEIDEADELVGDDDVQDQMNEFAPDSQFWEDSDETDYNDEL